MRRAAVVAGVYVAAAILLTWPLAAEIRVKLGALEGPGDPYLNLWTLGWGMQSWWRDPLGTLAGRAFDAPIFFPSSLTLTYSDHQLLQSLVAAPLYAATGQLTLTYNLVLLGSIAAKRHRHAPAGAIGDRFHGSRVPRRPGVGVLAVSHGSPPAPAVAGALLHAAGDVGADPCRRWAPVARRGVARCVRGASGHRVRVLRRDDRGGAGGGRPRAGVGNGAVARTALLVASRWRGRAGGGLRPARCGALSPVAGGRRVWPQPLRGGKSRRGLAELHAGAAGQCPLRAIWCAGAAASHAG